jgi:hypothetical protein
MVKFRVHDGNWELPDPKLLKIHACIGNFLHLSDQAETIDKILKDFEDCGGLAPSGSTNIEELLAASRLSLHPSNTNATTESQKPAEKQNAVSGLSLLPSNVDKTSHSQKSTKQLHPKQNEERLQAKFSDTENEPWTR